MADFAIGELPGVKSAFLLYRKDLWAESISGWEHTETQENLLFYLSPQADRR